MVVYCLSVYYFCLSGWMKKRKRRCPLCAPLHKGSFWQDLVRWKLTSISTFLSLCPRLQFFNSFDYRSVIEYLFDYQSNIEYFIPFSNKLFATWSCWKSQINKKDFIYQIFLYLDNNVFTQISLKSWSKCIKKIYQSVLSIVQNLID